MTAEAARSSLQQVGSPTPPLTSLTSLSKEKGVENALHFFQINLGLDTFNTFNKVPRLALPLKSAFMASRLMAQCKSALPH